ncbi:hypothetical protein GCM10022198_10290 [Klugiella xanthotipulae]|nr:glycosyl hydrolase family 28-related protein [Klugiella xanthotipulae]
MATLIHEGITAQGEPTFGLVSTDHPEFFTVRTGQDPAAPRIPILIGAVTATPTSAAPSLTMEVSPAPVLTGGVYTLFMEVRATAPRTGGEVALSAIPCIGGTFASASEVPIPLTSGWTQVAAAIEVAAPTGHSLTGLTLYNAQLGDQVEVRSFTLVRGAVTTAPGVVVDRSATETVSARPVRNVRDFGAVGDGVVDDTAAIARALAVGTGFATVFFPSGRYRITSQIVWDLYRVELHGQGAEVYADFAPTRFDANPPAKESYAVRVLSTAPFPGGSPAMNIRGQSGGIKFMGRGRTVNGLLIEGAASSVIDAHGKWSDGQRKNAHHTIAHMVFEGFHIAHTIGSYTFMLGFRNCVFRYNDTCAHMPLLSPTRSMPTTTVPTTDRGERIYYDACDFTNNSRTSWALLIECDQAYKFFNCSFDWISQLLWAHDGAQVDFVGCHMETPADPPPASPADTPRSPMLHEYEMFPKQGQFVNNVDKHRVRCYLYAGGTASVQITNSLLTINYYEADQRANPIPYLFQIDQLAVVAVHQSQIKTPSVIALSQGGGHLSVSDPAFFPEDEFIPMAGLNPTLDQLWDGGLQKAIIRDAWSGDNVAVTHTNAATGGPPVTWEPQYTEATGFVQLSTGSNMLTVTQKKDGASSLTLTVPVRTRLRVFGISLLMRGKPNGQGKLPVIRNFRMEFLDAGGAILGTLYDESDRHIVAKTNGAYGKRNPIDLKPTPMSLPVAQRNHTAFPGEIDGPDWIRYQLVRAVGHQGLNMPWYSGWNPDRVTHVRIVLPVPAGLAGDTYFIRQAFVNAFG